MTKPRQQKPRTLRPFYLPPGTRVGAYVIRDVIGQGGGQMDYLAESSDGCQVVLKMSRFRKGKMGSRDWEMHQRFMRQVSFFLQLQGVSGVAEIFAHGTHPDQSQSSCAYMVQEWVPGSVNILDWYRNKPHPLQSIVRAWITLAEFCVEMERRRICNRDLKPENILMTPKGVPKIIDFDSGTAEGVEAPMTHGAGGWPATKRYYSPEMCHVILSDWASHGQTRTPFEYSPSGDLHALGVILYQVLTGKYPFDESEDDKEFIEHIAYQFPEHPSDVNPQVPFELGDVTLKLLQKAPQLRYPSGERLAADLKELLTTSENWRRPFQTPSNERHSAAPSSQTSRASKTPTPHAPSATEGSAALNLAPSGMLLPGPKALAVRGPLSLLRVEPEPDPEPMPQPGAPRLRVLLLAAVLALGLVAPWLSLRQHEGEGSLFERGTMLLGKITRPVRVTAASIAVASAVASMELTGCVAVNATVRTGEKEWLAKCPPESRKAVNELGFETDGGLGRMVAGPNVIIPRHGGVEVRDGPVHVVALISTTEKGYVGDLIGQIRTGSDGASLRFTKFKLAQKGDPDDGPFSGPELDVCAYASAWGYGSIPGIPKAIDPPPASELHPGFIFLPTGALQIHFAH